MNPSLPAPSLAAKGVLKDGSGLQGSDTATTIAFMAFAFGLFYVLLKNLL